MAKKKQNEAQQPTVEQPEAQSQTAQQQMPEGVIILPKEYVLEGMENAMKEMHRMMSEARVKYGNRYNEKNEYEEFCRRFPGADDAERVLAEFEMVFDKKSSQPAGIRGTIKQLGDNARRYAYVKWLQEQKKGEQTAIQSRTTNEEEIAK